MLLVKCFLALALVVQLVKARFINSGRTHLSDFLKLKCDSLPYRTAYIDTRCYFALSKEVKLDDSSALCSSVIWGSKVATEIPGTVFDIIMVDDKKFHAGKDSSGAKRAICVYDSGYECEGDVPRSSIIPGKCVVRDEKKRIFLDAEAFCKNQGMRTPTIGNDLENKMVRAVLVRDGDWGQAWIRNIYHGESTQTWEPEKSFHRWTMCDRKIPRAYAGAAYQIPTGFRVWRMSSLINLEGYWENDGQNGLFDTVCVKNAENDFMREKKQCAPLHELDPETGLCEWTGASNACVQLIDFENRTWFMPMPKFPKESYAEYNLIQNGNPQDNNAVKVIVRRGCMFTGYAHSLDDRNYLADGRMKNSWILSANKRYGQHNVPSQKTGTLDDWWAGLTRCLCFCDPTEATVNDHYPEAPPGKKCVEHHVFDATTQTCEWKHDPKYCAQLITHDGRRQMVEIPNWPANRKYDVDHWSNETKRAENFHVSITDIIVRQHCWATLLWGRIDERMTLPTTGYGKHQVASYYNSLLGNENEGTRRVVCECIR